MVQVTKSNPPLHPKETRGRDRDKRAEAQTDKCPKKKKETMGRGK